VLPLAYLCHLLYESISFFTSVPSVHSVRSCTARPPRYYVRHSLVPRPLPSHASPGQIIRVPLGLLLRANPQTLAGLGQLCSSWQTGTDDGRVDSARSNPEERMDERTAGTAMSREMRPRRGRGRRGDFSRQDKGNAARQDPTKQAEQIVARGKKE